MVSACPNEGDPRKTVEQFVRDDSARVIGGLRSEGISGLSDVVRDEVVRQYPGVKVLTLDRESLAGVCFPRELTAYLLENLDVAGKNAILIPEPMSMNGWQHVFGPLKEKGFDMQVYYSSYACNHIPMCVKLL